MGLNDAKVIKQEEVAMSSLKSYTLVRHWFCKITAETKILKDSKRILLRLIESVTHDARNKILKESIIMQANHCSGKEV